MKIKHLFGLAVIAAMTASCSSNEDLGTAGPGTGTNESGVGYATFTINLPTTNGTRAGNPTYEQGTSDEYDVNDVTLLIFQKTATSKSEGDYTFVDKAELGNMAPWKDENNSGGITASATITAKLSNVALTSEGSTSNYYALAILNNKNSKGEDKITLPTSSTTSSPTPPVTYGSWNAASNTDETKLKDKGFYMANAPVFVADGEPTTLVNIDKVYATKQKAETNAATTIHVERGLAKVTVAALPTGGMTPSGTKYTNDKVDITAWKLDVTNKSTFPIHKTAGLNTNFTTIWSASTGAAPSTGRFVDGTNKAFKRVYWGVDPNYSDKKYYDGDATTSPKKTALDCCKDAFNMITNDQVDGAAGDANPQYCLENTFDLDNMKQGQTTRVVFKATYTPKSITPDENGTFYKIGKNEALWNSADLVKHITAAVTKVVADASVAGTTTTITLKGSDNDLTAAGNRMLKASNIKVTKATGDVVTLQTEDVKAINDKLGLSEGYGISTYEKGESYYIARIKHFGALTPWTEGQETYGINNDDNNTKYLGRYGVLRNNWYELNVGSVSGPGTPDVPTIKPDEPDDESYKYISVSVKILSWAKRSSTVDL